MLLFLFKQVWVHVRQGKVFNITGNVDATERTLRKLSGRRVVVDPSEVIAAEFVGAGKNNPVKAGAPRNLAPKTVSHAVKQGHQAVFGVGTSGGVCVARVDRIFNRLCLRLWLWLRLRW